MPKNHVMMVGNPGMGKSGLLNGIVGEKLFLSGISFGGGMTSVLKTVQHTDGIYYSDTPGLEDAEMREKAAAEITKGLKQEGCYKIIFVLGLEAGRVRPMDKAMMKQVMQAASIKAHEYGIIFNKVHKAEYKIMMENPKGLDPTPMERVTATLFSKQQPTVHVHVNPFDDALNEDDPPLKALRPETMHFVSNLPELVIQADAVTDIDPNAFEAMQEQFATALKSMDKNNTELKEELARVRESCAAQLEEMRGKKDSGGFMDFLNGVGDVVVKVLGGPVLGKVLGGLI